MTVDSVARAKSALSQSLKDLLPSLRSLPESTIEKKVGKDKFEEAALEVESFLKAGLSGEMTQLEQFALTTQVLRCLGNYLTSINVPVTLNNFVTHLGLLAHAVDQAFPGYVNSRLLRFAIGRPAGVTGQQ